MPRRLMVFLFLALTVGAASAQTIMSFSGHKNRAMVEVYILRNAARQARSVDKRDEYLERYLAERKSDDAERIAPALTISRV